MCVRRSAVSSLLRRLQGNCYYLQAKLLEKCWDVPFVRRPHLLVGGARSVPTNLVEVQGQQELREIEDEQGKKEVGWNGELKVKQ